MPAFKDFFISYGRRESLGFAARLHRELKLAGYDAWFDKVNIPDGDDYAKRINHGIESAHNFVVVMAPRCMTSPYCLIELEYARILGKRVIPVNQTVIFSTAENKLSHGDREALAWFYRDHRISGQNIKTSKDVLKRFHELIGATDWLDGKELLSDDDCECLAQWAQPYENFWHRHDDPDYLKDIDPGTMRFGECIDEMSGIAERVTAVTERQKDFVHMHTEILERALLWQKNHRENRFLMTGRQRQDAETWLLTVFRPPKQPPCLPSALHCDFICESRKNAENMMTDAFICYDAKDRPIRDKVIRSLARYGITTWVHDRDIRKGADFARAIEEGIENADNFFYFISPRSAKSEYCQKELDHAVGYNKRIVPLLIEQTPDTDTPEMVRGLQYTDFTDNKTQSDYDRDIDDIVRILGHDRAYHKDHKILLSKALKWNTENRKPSFLLRGFNLENAQTWLRLNSEREQYPPTRAHRDLISASEAARGQLSTDVFISYSRKDGDFARKLNTSLQEADKTTWFDQESISKGVDFEKAIYDGIRNSDNFLFVISPDAVESEYCEGEVNYAAELSKRFITVLHRKINDEKMPESMRTINWIDFNSTTFGKAFPELIQAIELDREHARQHTVFQQRASEWSGNDRNEELLMNKTACERAETWLLEAEAGAKQPVPTQLQRDFIRESRAAIKAAAKAVERRRRILLVSLQVAVIILALTTFALFQWREADKQKIVAKTKTKEAKYYLALTFEEKAGSALDHARENPDPIRNYQEAWLYTLAALNQDIPEGKRLPVSLARLQDREIRNGIMGRQIWASPSMLIGNVAVFSPDGNRLATASSDSTVRVWDAKTGELVKSLAGHSGPVRSMCYNGDGSILASASDDRTVRVWNMEDGKTLRKLEGHSEPVRGVDYSPDGKTIASASDDGSVIVWDADSGKLLFPLLDHPGSVASVSHSPDGARLATASANIVTVWNLEKKEKLLLLAEHSDDVTSTSHSPDGKRLISSSKDGTVMVWDAESGKRLLTLTGHSGGVNHAAFNSDGNLVASASGDRSVRVWNPENGEQLLTLTGHSSAVTNVDFSDECLVSASADNALFIHDPESGKPLLWPVGHSAQVTCVSHSADGKHIASASSDNTVRVWDAKTGKHLLSLTGHSDKVECVCFGNGRLASASRDKTVRVWDAETGKELLSLTGHSGPVFSVCFSPDGSLLATGSGDGTVRVWDSENGERFLTLTGHTDSVSSVSYSRDGKRLASGSADHSVRVWDTETGNEFLFMGGHADAVSCVSYSPDGKFIVSASRDATVRVWDAETGKKVRTLAGHLGGVNSVGWSSDGKFVVSGSDDGTILAWNAKTGEKIFSLTAHSDRVTSVSFSPEGNRIASGSADRTVRVWNAESGKRKPASGLDIPLGASYNPDGKVLVTSAAFTGTLFVRSFEKNEPAVALTGHSAPISSVAQSPDGDRIASGSFDKTVRVWDSKTGKQLLLLEGHTRGVACVGYSPDGKRLASSSYDKTVRVWDAETGESLLSLDGHSGIVFGVTYSPDGRSLASASFDGIVRVWDPETGEPVLSFSSDKSDSFTSVCYSPDGKRLASASFDNSVYVRNAETGEPVCSLAGHSAQVVSTSFSPDGSRFVSGSYDKTVRVWNAETGEELLVLKGHSAPVKSAIFSPDGSRILSASGKDTLLIWDADTGERIPGAGSTAGYPRENAFVPVEAENRLHSLNAHSPKILSVRYDSDGGIRVFCSYYDRSAVRVRDGETGEQLLLLAGHSKPLTSACHSPDGSLLATASGDNTVRVWDAKTGRHLLSFTGHSKPVTSVAFSPDGNRIASASEDKTARIWDANTGKEIFSPMDGHSGSVTSVGFDGDGSLLATASVYTIYLWDAKTGNRIGILTGHSDLVTSAVLSPDGDYLASASDDGTVRVWDTSTGEQFLALEGHSSIRHSPKQKHIATVSADNILSVWDVEKGDRLFSLADHPGRIVHTRYSPDGNRLAFAYHDNTMRVCELELVNAYLKDNKESDKFKIVYKQSSDFLDYKIEGIDLVDFKGGVHRLPFIGIGRSQTTCPNTMKDGVKWMLESAKKNAVNASNHVGKGNLFAKRGEMNKAVAEYEEALRRDKTLKLDPHAEAVRIAAHEYLSRGDELARLGLVETATGEYEKAAALIPNFEPETEAVKVAVREIVRKGENLAGEGHFDEAVAEFERALELDKNLEFDPKTRAGKLAAPLFLEKGGELAEKGLMEEAASEFEKALDLDKTLGFDPQAKAAELAAPFFVEEGRKLARECETEAALAEFNQVKWLAPDLEIQAATWNTLCRFGSLCGSAALVDDSCAKAVELAESTIEQADCRDSRGIARALTGDNRGAVEDFRFFSKHAKDEKAKADRLKWIEILQQGENPFTESLLEELREESTTR